MDFNSYIFILVFMPIVIILYYLCNLVHRRVGTWFLSMASFVFLAYADIRFVYFVLLSIGFNFLCGIILSICKDKRLFVRVVLACGIIGNIFVLGIFKYTSFVLSNLSRFMEVEFTTKALLVPLGISFLTFQQIAFLVDIYRGEIKKLVFTDYVFYVTFFPKLIQGPIAGYQELTAQLYKKQRRYPNAKHFACGLWFFAAGLAKKVLVADVLAEAVKWGYGQAATELTSMEAFLVMLCYTLQIYFDFSGYSQMALGVAKLLNITLPNNFATPYRAVSISEFWKCWHISLTSFLRKYLYFPLGGNRKGTIRTYLNTMIIFLVSGLWHGASWNFVVWGAFHGIAMCFDKFMRQVVPPIQKGKKFLQVISWAVTFGLVNVLWVFFRAPSFSHAISLLEKAFSFESTGVREAFLTCFAIPEYAYITGKITSLAPIFEQVQSLEMLIFVGISMLISLCSKDKIEEFKPTWGRSIGAMVLFLWAVISLSHVSEYIYGSF